MGTPIIPKLLGGSLVGTGLALLGHRASNLTEQGDKTQLCMHGTSLRSMPKALRGLQYGPVNASFTVKGGLFHGKYGIEGDMELVTGYANGKHKSWLQRKQVGVVQDGVIVYFTAESPDGGNPEKHRSIFNSDPYFPDGTIVHVKKIERVPADVDGIKKRQDFLEMVKRIQESVDNNSSED